MDNRIVVRIGSSRFRAWFIASFLLLFIRVLSPVTPGQASSTIYVNSFDDDKSSNDGRCTLREAIIAANSDKRSGNRSGECIAGSGADFIVLPAGHYLLTRSDNGQEDAAATGDLDITTNLTITGAGADITVVDGNGITDRVFHTLAGQITISGVTMQDGHVPGDGGGLYLHWIPFPEPGPPMTGMSMAPSVFFTFGVIPKVSNYIAASLETFSIEFIAFIVITLPVLP